MAKSFKNNMAALGVVMEAEHEGILFENHFIKVLMNRHLVLYINTVDWMRNEEELAAFLEFDIEGIIGKSLLVNNPLNRRADPINLWKSGSEICFCEKSLWRKRLVQLLS
jgi:hypothetical protein